MPKVCAVLFALNGYDEKFPFWFKNSTSTFKKWNPDIELKIIRDGYTFDNNLSHISKCILDLMENENYTKVIVIEADTITCGPFTEFLDENEYQFCVTPNYSYNYSDILQPKNIYMNKNFNILEIENLNPGIFSVNSLEAAKFLVNLHSSMNCIFEPVLNYILYHETYSYSMKVIGFPYSLSSYVYNCRFTGLRSLNEKTENGEIKFSCDEFSPIISFLSPFKRLHVHEGKLLNHDGKWIKCIHLASSETTYNIIKNLDKNIIDFLDIDISLPYKQ